MNFNLFYRPPTSTSLRFIPMAVQLFVITAAHCSMGLFTRDSSVTVSTQPPKPIFMEALKGHIPSILIFQYFFLHRKSKPIVPRN